MIFNHFRLFFFLLLFFHPCFLPVFSSHTTLLLQDVLREISANQTWDFEDVKVSRLDLRRFKFRTYRRHDFRLRLRDTHLSVRFSDDVSSWNKFGKPTKDFASLVNEVRSFAVLDAFKVKGPFELRVTDHQNENPSLLLPMNRTHSGFKRILVGKGITVAVREARGVLAFQASDLGSTQNKSPNSENDKFEFWPIWDSFCRPLVQIQVSGSSSFVAYRTRNPSHYVESSQITNETIELLADKCYISPVYKKKRHFLVDSLSSTLSMLEKLLQSYFGKSRDGLVGLIRGNITASVAIRFQLELERRNNASNGHRADLSWRTRPDVSWRTRPDAERVWFDVLARVENERPLKLLAAKKMRPPFIADTVLWGELSNTSLSKFPSLLVPSEALTLDIKW